MRNNSSATKLDLRETQIAIKSVKDYFQRDLARRFWYTIYLKEIFHSMWVEDFYN